jgi:hypothetical protein
MTLAPGATLDLTVEELGRIAEEQFVAAIRALAAFARAVEGGELPERPDGRTVAAAARKTLEHLFDERQRVAERVRKEAGGRAGGAGLDLDAARDEVRRRMARLRAAERERGLPE